MNPIDDKLLPSSKPPASGVTPTRHLSTRRSATSRPTPCRCWSGRPGQRKHYSPRLRHWRKTTTDPIVVFTLTLNGLVGYKRRREVPLSKVLAEMGMTRAKWDKLDEAERSVHLQVEWDNWRDGITEGGAEVQDA